jgi:hypothetical protein
MSDRHLHFLAALGHDELPLGVHYTDDQPADGLAPKPGLLPTAEDEANQNVDWPAVWHNFSCVLGTIWRARKKGVPAYFSREQYGCLGGVFYLGYNQPQLEAIVYYVSTGIPGVLEGEHYLPTPEDTRRFYEYVQPDPAPKRFCVFKPITQFAVGEKPELVIFFARPEVISALHQLTTFITDDYEAVMSPWGAGCTNLVTWPLRYLKEGWPKAVLGGWDPSCRKYLKTDEISLSLPSQWYETMLDQWPESFLATKEWQTARKKVERSQRAWGEK